MTSPLLPLRAVSPIALAFAFVALASCGSSNDAGPVQDAPDAAYDSTADATRVDATKDAVPGEDGPADAATDHAGGEVCDDNVDNDNNGLTDCADPACESKVCRSSQGPCDVAESCKAGVCPADAFEPATKECRPVGGDCDVADHCTGKGAACPDEKKPIMTPCRPTAGVCDQAEVCDGSKADCPADDMQPAGTVCRGLVGPCDLEEKCDGVSPSCPADQIAGDTVVCRDATNGCDAEERCTGLTVQCPIDALRPAGYECRPSGGGCDSPELCDGMSPVCPNDMNACQWDHYCISNACEPKTALGAACVNGASCLSGICSDGVCCDQSCDGPCRSCVEGGSVGHCLDHTYGTDPENGCGPVYDCLSGTCAAGCNPPYTPSENEECKDNAYCNGSSECVPKLTDGEMCSGGLVCASGFCVNGICCE